MKQLERNLVRIMCRYGDATEPRVLDSVLSQFKKYQSRYWGNSLPYPPE